MLTKTLLVAFTAVALTGCFDYSDGDRIGTLTKFSRKGYFCKTWEGQMFLGGMRKQTNVSSDGKSTTSSMVANTWDFTVENTALVQPLLKALEKGDPVHVRYNQEAITFCRSDGDNYFITAIVGEAPDAPTIPVR